MVLLIVIGFCVNYIYFSRRFMSNTFFSRERTFTRYAPDSSENVHKIHRKMMEIATFIGNRIIIIISNYDLLFMIDAVSLVSKLFDCFQIFLISSVFVRDSGILPQLAAA